MHFMEVDSFMLVNDKVAIAKMQRVIKYLSFMFYYSKKSKLLGFVFKISFSNAKSKAVSPNSVTAFL